MKDEKYETWSIPEPFLLNCWKHHLQFIRIKVENFIKSGTDSCEELKKSLLLIGISQMDLYTGNLSPPDITNQVKNILVNQNCFQKSYFENWINTPPRGYKIVSIKDSSKWTLRMGQSERYIHLHPSRYSTNTTRIKANTLKTIIALQWMMRVEQKPLSLEIVNKARIKFFGAAPVKSFAHAQGIQKQMMLLFP